MDFAPPVGPEPTNRAVGPSKDGQMSRGVAEKIGIFVGWKRSGDSKVLFCCWMLYNVVYWMFLLVMQELEVLAEWDYRRVAGALCLCCEARFQAAVPLCRCQKMCGAQLLILHFWWVFWWNPCRCFHGKLKLIGRHRNESEETGTHYIDPLDKGREWNTRVI